MRLLLALFSFLALALAPFASPATAMAVSSPCSAEMVSHHGDRDQMPSGSVAKAHGDLCCIGLASALPVASSALPTPPLAKPLIAASKVAELNGVQPAGSDPPPRA